jgi:uncharacterized protein YigE (DUF2233 family)
MAWRLIAIALFLLVWNPLREAQSQGAKKANLGTTLLVADAGSWRSVQRGIEARKISFERLEPAYTLDFKLLRFDSQFITPRVLQAAQFQLKTASVKTFAELAGAVAVVNANYFDEKGRALAYLKTAEKEVNRSVSRHALYTGIFGLGEAGPFVAHRDEFQPAQASEALQSGPLLLHRAAPVEVTTGLGRYARRSVIGLDKEGKLIVGVTDAIAGGFNFAELQELFSQPRWQLNTVELLNLDGGGSAQLYLKSGKIEDWLPGTSEVPVAIGFFNKPN